jgi:hypothetical protein
MAARKQQYPKEPRWPCACAESNFAFRTSCRKCGLSRPLEQEEDVEKGATLGAFSKRVRERKGPGPSRTHVLPLLAPPDPNTPTKIKDECGRVICTVPAITASAVRMMAGVRALFFGCLHPIFAWLLRRVLSRARAGGGGEALQRPNVPEQFVFAVRFHHGAP